VACRLALALLLTLLGSPARGVEEIHIEEDIADLLATPPAAEEETVQGRQWAILPQVGYVRPYKINIPAG
jgi:hypothetical protein